MKLQAFLQQPLNSSNNQMGPLEPKPREPWLTEPQGMLRDTPKLISGNSAFTLSCDMPGQLSVVQLPFHTGDEGKQV